MAADLHARTRWLGLYHSDDSGMCYRTPAVHARDPWYFLVPTSFAIRYLPGGWPKHCYSPKRGH
jgi:hypothetical protein